MAFNVVAEAKRCLHCKVPQCRKGCPISTNIPEMIAMFRESRMEEAGSMVFENNPLSIVCSLVCNHEAQCEGHCVLGRKGDPVHISNIENYISEHYFDKMRPEMTPRNGMRAAIIGSGPAGITIAICLAKKGYDVTLFDSRPEIGGVMRYGIPEYRLPKKILDKYADRLRAMGISIRPNTTIGGAISVDDLFRDGYSSVFIGTGVWRPRSLRIPGETLGNAHFGIDYLASPETYRLGETVAVLGAGNSAVDVARTALRQGARNVTMYSRGTHISASQSEIDFALADGVELMQNKIPVRIVPEGVIMMDSMPDEDGHPVAIEGTELLYKADSVIIAIGQGPKDKIVSTTTGINTTNRGLLQVDENGSTTREGVFASGDVVSGAKTVVEAVNYSKMVAEQMDAYMQRKAAEAKGEATEQPEA